MSRRRTWRPAGSAQAAAGKHSREELSSHAQAKSAGPEVASVDLEKCFGCEVCVEACPEEAIYCVYSARVIQNKCTGCGLCLSICPTSAIFLTQRESQGGDGQ